MELILQDMLKTNFIIPLYPSMYRETAISVPPTSGASNLRFFIYFDLDNRFTAKQEQGMIRIDVADKSIISLITLYRKIQK